MTVAIENTLERRSFGNTRHCLRGDVFSQVHVHVLEGASVTDVAGKGGPVGI